MSQWWEDYDPAVDDDRREPDPADEAFEDLDPERDPFSDSVYDVPDDDPWAPQFVSIRVPVTSSLP